MTSHEATHGASVEAKLRNVNWTYVIGLGVAFLVGLTPGWYMAHTAGNDRDQAREIDILPHSGRIVGRHSLRDTWRVRNGTPESQRVVQRPPGGRYFRSADRIRAASIEYCAAAT